MSLTSITVETDDVLRVSKAAERLGVSIMTIHRWVKAGRIMSVSLGGILFIPQSEIDRVKASQDREV